MVLIGSLLSFFELHRDTDIHRIGIVRQAFCGGEDKTGDMLVFQLQAHRRILISCSDWGESRKARCCCCERFNIGGRYTSELWSMQADMIQSHKTQSWKLAVMA